MNLLSRVMPRIVLTMAGLFISGQLYAEGPIFQHQDTIAQQEFENVYKDIRSKANNSSLDPLNISSATISSATINALITQSINGTFIGLGRNRIINGEMIFNQVSGTATVTVNDPGPIYSADTFSGSGIVSSGVFTLQRLTATPPDGFSNYLRASCTTVDGTIGAADNYLVNTRLEGYSVRDFFIGSASAKQVTLSFWVRSSLTGTYSGAFRNSAFNRTYPFEYAINSADTWEKKTITLTMDTTGTWLTGTGFGLGISWALAIGSNFQGTAGAWVGAGRLGTANQVNFMSSNSSRTWDITGVQLEIGEVATAYEYRPFQIELGLCQRYYEKSYALDTIPGTNSGVGGGIPYESVVATTIGTPNGPTIHFVQPKRSAPTMSLWTHLGVAGSWKWRSAAGTDTDRATSANGVHFRGFEVSQSSTELWAYGQWVADSRL